MKNIEKLFYTHKIKLPSDVEILLQQNSISFKGPLGFLEVNMTKIDSLGLGFLHMNTKSNELEIYVKKVSKESKAFFGSLLSFFQNNIYGISQGFLIYLELIGVGYRAILHENKNQESASQRSLMKSSLINVSDRKTTESISIIQKTPSRFTSTLLPNSFQQIELKIGQSHEIFFQVPQNIRAFSVKPTLFCLYGLDKQQVTQIASEIRNLRSPEPYKGKGIRYKDEIVRIKVGKKK